MKIQLTQVNGNADLSLCASRIAGCINLESSLNSTARHPRRKFLIKKENNSKYAIKSHNTGRVYR